MEARPEEPGTKRTHEVMASIHEGWKASVGVEHEQELYQPLALDCMHVAFNNLPTLASEVDVR